MHHQLSHLQPLAFHYSHSYHFKKYNQCLLATNTLDICIVLWDSTNMSPVDSTQIPTWLFLCEDDVTALAGAAAYRGPQNFNSVCVRACVSVNREISGLEGSRDKRSFKGLSLELLATDVLLIWNRTTRRPSANMKIAKITFSRSVVLGYLLLAEPKHIAHHQDKRNHQATSLMSPQQFRLWESMV